MILAVQEQTAEEVEVEVEVAAAAVAAPVLNALSELAVVRTATMDPALAALVTRKGARSVVVQAR